MSGINIFVELFATQDLPDLAQIAGLALAVPSGSLSAAAARMNEAFSDYVNAAAMQTRDSSAGQRRDWCAGLEAGCTELMVRLGRDSHDIGFGPPPSTP